MAQKIALQGQLRLPSSKVWRTLCWVPMVLSPIIHRNYHCRASLLASSSFNGYSAPMALATAKPEVQAKSWPLPGEVLSSSLFQTPLVQKIKTIKGPWHMVLGFDMMKFYRSKALCKLSLDEMNPTQTLLRPGVPSTGDGAGGNQSFKNNEFLQVDFLWDPSRLAGFERSTMPTLPTHVWHVN